MLLGNKVETSEDVIVGTGTIGAQDFDSNEVGIFGDTKGCGSGSARTVGTVAISVYLLTVKGKTK